MSRHSYGDHLSQETMEHQNNFTLIGNTKQRGDAWHYRATQQGAETNHYPGPIPVEDVKRRLLDWKAVPRRVPVEFPATVETMTHLNDAGEPVRWAVQADRQAAAASDRDHANEVHGLAPYTATKDGRPRNAESSQPGTVVAAGQPGLLHRGCARHDHRGRCGRRLSRMISSSRRRSAPIADWLRR